jgi:hypothetical protein
MIGERAVRALDHEVTGGGAKLLAVAPHDTIPESDEVVVDLHPVSPLGLPIRKAVSTDAWIDNVVIRIMRSGCDHGYLGPRTAASIRDSLFYKVINGGLIKAVAPTLVYDRPVPVKAECLKGPQHVIGDSRDYPRHVEVLDP